MRRLPFLFLLLLSLLSSLSWGSCTTNTDSYPVVNSTSYIDCWLDKQVAFQNTSGTRYKWTVFFSGYGALGGVMYIQKSYTSSVAISLTRETNKIDNGKFQTICGYIATECTTQAEADSVGCALNPSAPGCVQSPGEQDCADAKAACEAYGGTPDYVVSVDKQHCTGACDMCATNADGTYKNERQQKVYDGLKESCCGSGGSFTGKCIKFSDGQSVFANGEQINLSNFSRSCEFNVPVNVLTGATPGCEVGDDSTSTGSSSSGEGSGGGSSSSGESGEYHAELEEIIKELADILYVETEIAAGVEAIGDDTDSLVTLVDSAVGILGDIRDVVKGLEGGNGDTIIVNVKGDTNIINNDIHVNPNIDLPPELLTTFDSIQAMNDSMYSGMKGLTTGLDSLLKLFGSEAGDCYTVECLDTAGSKWVNSVDSALAVVNPGWEENADSVLKSWGYGGNFRDGVGDTTEKVFFGQTGYDADGCLSSDTSCHSYESEQQRYGRYGDSLKNITKQKRDSLPSKLNAYYDTLKNYNLVTKWSNDFYQAMGSRVPDINTCPDQCFGSIVDWSLNMPGNVSVALDNLDLRIKVCEPMPGMEISVLNLLKFIFRLLTTVACLSMVMWEVSTKRGTIGF